MVTAKGGGSGAGIGGGIYTSGNNITISGGTVTANGGVYGAGIGGGGCGFPSGDIGGGGVITISGGTVIANGNGNGAGIGGGGRSSGADGGSGGTVTISGGTIKATGSNDGANIGGGAGASDNGTLKNGDGDDVFLTTIQLLGSGAGNATVTSLTTDLTTYGYGVNDVFSNSLGWLYFYLPVGTETTQVGTSTGTFTGGAVTAAASSTAFYFAAGGADGREIELRNNDTAIQWRYAGETEWYDLVTLTALTGADGTDGADGRKIELRVDSGFIQWRYIGDEGWNNIVALSTITGPQGPQGEQGAAGTNGADGIDGRGGSDGQDGADGSDSIDGRDGNGITSITKTATYGNVDTYTIFFTNGTSTTFTVTNGKDGVGVASAAFNDNGELMFTLTDGTQINLGLLPGGSVPAASEAVSGERDSTGAAVPIALGAAALLSAQLWWLLPLLRRKIFKL